MNSARPISRVFSCFAIAVVAGVCVYASVALIRDFVIEPRTASVFPYVDEVGVDLTTPIRLTFNKAMASESILPTTLTLHNEHGVIVPATVTYDDATYVAVLQPSSALEQGATYEVTLTRNICDRHKRPLLKEQKWHFTTGIAPARAPAEGPGGPILLITSKTNGFSQYYAEILRSEGFNEFEVNDIAEVSPAGLARHDIAILGEMPIDDLHIRVLAEWVRTGGKLIAMRPPARLAEAFGLRLSATEVHAPVLHSGYLQINPGTAAGAGLVHQAIQFHGDADLFVAGDATVFAALCKEGKVASTFPAVASVRAGNGTAIIFSYDLARSVAYTRQGNPEWSGMERDGMPPVRADDLFYGPSEEDPEPDWVDPQTITIPQADQQQRLLANLITLTTSDNGPLPHFWYLPRGLKAAVVMTGDDHGRGGTAGRFRSYQRRSARGCLVDNWECVRATSNIFVGSISPAEATYFTRMGFEIGLHVYTACNDWPMHKLGESDGRERRQVIRESADAIYSQQLEGFTTKYPEIPSPKTNRTDCITWGDYDTQPQVELSHRIRLDTNYYYWPPKWVRDKPGFFTGSGLPMRFARRDGTLIDVYQATTQMTDESGQSYPFTVDTLLANALDGPEYFGVFVANMHNDEIRSPGANAIIASAQKRHVPVITAAQLLNWLDGRNASEFRNLNWSGDQLSFSIDAGIGANGLEALLPLHCASGDLDSLSLDGRALPYQGRTVAGLAYAVVPAMPGRFVASYHRPAANQTASY